MATDRARERTADRAAGRWSLVAVAGVLAATLAGCGGAPPLKANYVRGVDHYDAGRLRSAAEAFELAVQDHPEDVRVYYNLGLTYHDLHRDAVAAGDERAAGYGDRAEAAYRRVLELEKGNPRATIALATLLRESDRAADADELLASYEPNGIEGETLPLWTRAGEHYSASRAATDDATRSAELAEAERLFREVLALDEEHLAACSSLVEILAADPMRRAEADDLLRRAMEMHPHDFTLRLQHAEMALAAARGLDLTTEEGQVAMSAAETSFRKAGVLSPSSTSVALGLAEIAECRGDVGGAVRYLWKARDAATPNDLEGLGYASEEDRARFDEEISERLQALYPRLAEWERR